jgi:hypothetical protein
LNVIVLEKPKPIVKPPPKSPLLALSDNGFDIKKVDA